MARIVNVRGKGGGDAPQTYNQTTSVYGATRGDSVGYNARNPKAYLASVGKKAYPGRVDNPSPDVMPSKFSAYPDKQT